MDFIKEIVTGQDVYKYGVVSVSTASFILLFTWILTSSLGVFHAYSVAISLELSIIWSFFILDKWTFKDGIKKHSTLRRFLQYNVVGSAGLGVNEAIMLFFVYVVGLNYLIAEFFAMVFTFGFQFLMNRKFSWARYKKFNT